MKVKAFESWTLEALDTLYESFGEDNPREFYEQFKNNKRDSIEIIEQSLDLSEIGSEPLFEQMITDSIKKQFLDSHSVGKVVTQPSPKK